MPWGMERSLAKQGQKRPGRVIHQVLNNTMEGPSVGAGRSANRALATRRQLWQRTQLLPVSLLAGAGLTPRKWGGSSSSHSLDLGEDSKCSSWAEE